VLCHVVTSSGEVLVQSAAVQSSHSLQCTAPPAAVGTAQLTLYDSGSNAAVAGPVQYRYHAAVSRFSVTPANGPTTGGTIVTVDGVAELLDASVADGIALDVWCRIDGKELQASIVQVH
jgi:hypothetical protein